MTRLEKAKWLKRAKKELVKRFGGNFDGDTDSDKVRGHYVNHVRSRMKKVSCYMTTHSVTSWHL